MLSDLFFGDDCFLPFTKVMSKNKKIIKLNFYGAPGVGKTTLAARVFAALKEKNKNVEYVSEYAKEKVQEGVDVRLLDEEERIEILGEQFKRERRLIDCGVDYIVTDSPMFLTAFYHPYSYVIDIVKRRSEKYKEKGLEEVHFWIEMETKDNYNQEGRSHDVEESQGINLKMKGFLSYCGLEYNIIKGNPKQRLDKVLKILGEEDV